MNADDVRQLVVKRYRRYPKAQHIVQRRAQLRSLKPSDTQPALRGGRIGVYVILNHVDAVQYVGQTAHPPQRMSAHRRSGILQPDGRALWFVAADRSTARSCEMAFIATLNPRHNLVGGEFQWETGRRGLTLAAIAELAEAAA